MLRTVPKVWEKTSLTYGNLRDVLRKVSNQDTPAPLFSGSLLNFVKY